jgi:hypothetical protein
VGVERVRLLAVFPVRNDWFDAFFNKTFTKLGAVVSLVGNQANLRGYTLDQGNRRFYIVRVATRQTKYTRPPLRVADGVALGIPPTTRTTDRLRALPPFPPQADR